MGLGPSTLEELLVKFTGHDAPALLPLYFFVLSPLKDVLRVCRAGYYIFLKVDPGDHAAVLALAGDMVIEYVGQVCQEILKLISLRDIHPPFWFGRKSADQTFCCTTVANAIGCSIF